VKRWDMHVHTLWSDGSTPVKDVVKYAADAGLAGLAITDHDSMDMVLPASLEAEQYGLEMIPGVEISSMDNSTGRKVHLLVYYPSKAEILQPYFDDIAVQRKKAGWDMFELVKKRFPITEQAISFYSQNSGTIYRPHIMRALMDMGYAERIYGKRYLELFGPQGSCRRNVIYLDAIEAAKLARESGGVVFLAHPDVYNSYDIAEKLALGGLIDGIENSYPRKKAENADKHTYLIEKYSLLTSGGTDYHGWYTPDPHPLGFCTSDEYEILKIKELAYKRR